MFGIGMPELIIILVIILIIFGAGKLPEIGGGMGKAIKNFRSATTDADKKEAEKFNLDDWKNYVKIGISKINIGPKDSGDACLKFDEQGTLHPANIYEERINEFKNQFASKP